MATTITINGVDQSSKIAWKTVRKRDNLNQQVDTLAFTVNRTGSETYEPEVGQEVVFERDGDTIFGGVILRIEESIEASTVLVYRVECVDYSQYLKRQLVTERYTETTVGAIIADLVANYTADGITANNVVGGLAIKSFSFDRLTVADSLQKLADAISYVWYVDYDKDIHFFPKNAELAPFSLTDTSSNYVYNSLRIVSDLSQIRNSVLVQGGEIVSDTARMETFDGDGVKSQFPLTNKYNELPTVTVASVPQAVGVEFLDDDASFDVMWNFNEKYIRFTTGNIPASGTNNIEVEGTYLFPIVVKVPAPTSIATFGTYEFALTDRSIRSQDEAIDRALGMLISYRAELYEGDFRTREAGLRSGQVLTITSTQRGKDIEVLIQSVDARMTDPLGNILEYTVRFATMKSIGIIDYLQGQLRSREVIVGDEETLLNFFPFDDEINASDSVATPTRSTGPYTWGNFDWGYGTWS